MSASRQRVAILGATGHVGKCLTASLLAGGDYDVTLVARDFGRVAAFLDGLPNGTRAEECSFAAFPDGRFDVVVNCVGVGNPARLASSGASIFALTEQFDSLAMDYLERQPGSLYVAFSSGAAYGGDFTLPADDDSPAVFHMNDLAPADYYGVAKLASEAKHRSAREMAIVDLRLFGLFSRYADPSAPYLMNDVFRALADDTVLKVGPENIVRDYVHPDDLAALLVALMAGGPRNDVFDVYSAAPVTKFEMLDDFSARYGLKYDVLEVPAGRAATGVKPNYYSKSRRAATLGYEPARTSLQALVKEIDALLRLHEGGST